MADPVKQWKDGPAGGTPLDAASLIDLEQRLRGYTDEGVGAVPTAPDATTIIRGLIRLAGDLGGTADAPTVPGLAGKADTTALTAGLAAKQDLSEKDQANGYAGLDAVGKLATAALPPLPDVLPRLVAGGDLGATPTLAMQPDDHDVWLIGVLTANATLTVTGLVAGQSLTLLLAQDATGGRTLSITANGSTAAVSLISTAGAATVVSAHFDGTDLYVRGGDNASTVESGGAQVVAGDTLPRPSGVAFPFSTVAPDPGPGAAPNRYNSFPGQVLCANGEWVVTYRLANTHNISNPTGTTESRLYQRRSRDLNTWSDPVLVYTTPAHYDARDPCLYREPGTRRVYMTWCDIAAVGEPGATYLTKNWIVYSDDDCKTWSAPVQIPGMSNTGMPLRRNSDGVWRIPFFKLTTINESWVAECSDPDPMTGTWTTRKVMSHATKHRNEWDFTEATRPKSDQVNNAAGYDAVQTAIVVDNPAKFATGVQNQNVKNRRTGEVMAVTAVDVPSSTLTVTRGVNGSTAQAINDNDILSIAGTVESVWVAAFRNSAGSQMAVSISTDKAATWLPSVEIQTISAMLYDGWPCPVTFGDDSVGVFVRGTNGLRLVQCLDLTNVMDPTAWAEPAGGLNALWRPLDYVLGTTGIPVGKFQPVRVGDVWYGSYYIETDLIRDKAEVRFGVFNERDLRAKQTYIATAQKIADGSPGSTWGQLTTPDTIQIRTKGGKFKVGWSTKSNQASGTISSYQIDVMHTGRRWVNNAVADEVDVVLGNPIRRAPESATRLANSGTTGLAQPGWNYYDEGEGIVELGPGVHTFKLVVQQANTAVGRTFSERKLKVEPL